MTEDFQRQIQYGDTTFTMDKLVGICVILNLDYRGEKRDLLQTICNGLVDINNLVKPTNDDGDGDESIDDNADDEDVGRPSRRVTDKSDKNFRFVMNFKDIEDPICSFDGIKYCLIEHWLNNFEETVILFDWSDLEKLIFTKKKLTGLAKLFIQSEGVIQSWHSLRKLLLNECFTKTNNVQVHKMSLTRKIYRRNLYKNIISS